MKAIFFEKIREGAQLPVRAHAEDAGADLHYCGEDLVINPSETVVAGTGLRMFMPSKVKGINAVPVAKVCSRSGLAAKSSVFVLNAPGIIDAGYRGEVKVILHNSGSEPHIVRNGDRIAQVLFEMAIIPAFEEGVIEDDETTRGEKGFGSTGC